MNDEEVKSLMQGGTPHRAILADLQILCTEVPRGSGIMIPAAQPRNSGTLVTNQIDYWVKHSLMGGVMEEELLAKGWKGWHVVGLAPTRDFSERFFFYLGFRDGPLLPTHVTFTNRRKFGGEGLKKMMYH